MYLVLAYVHVATVALSSTGGSVSMLYDYEHGSTMAVYLQGFSEILHNVIYVPPPEADTRGVTTIHLHRHQLSQRPERSDCGACVFNIGV